MGIQGYHRVETGSCGNSSPSWILIKVSSIFGSCSWWKRLLPCSRFLIKPWKSSGITCNSWIFPCFGFGFETFTCDNGLGTIYHESLGAHATSVGLKFLTQYLGLTLASKSCSGLTGTSVLPHEHRSLSCRAATILTLYFFGVEQTELKIIHTD